MNDWWKAPVLQGPENDYGEHDYLVEELPENYGKWIRHSRCDSCGKKRFLVFRSVYHFYCWDGWYSTENSECWKCMIKDKLRSIKYKFKKRIDVIKMTLDLYKMHSKTKRDIKKCYNLALKIYKGDSKDTYTISDYSCYDNYTVKSQTENVSNIVDKMIRITAKLTEHYSGDIYYIIQALYEAIDKKESFNRILFFREDGVASKNVPLIYYDFDYLQTWHLTYDAETNITVFKRVHIRWNA